MKIYNINFLRQHSLVLSVKNRPIPLQIWRREQSSSLGLKYCLTCNCSFASKDTLFKSQLASLRFEKTRNPSFSRCQPHRFTLGFERKGRSLPCGKSALIEFSKPKCAFAVSCVILQIVTHCPIVTQVDFCTTQLRKPGLCKYTWELMHLQSQQLRNECWIEILYFIEWKV